MSEPVRVGVFGGSGFYSFLDDVEQIPVDTPYGAPSAPVSVGTVAGRRVAFIPRHGVKHEFPPQAVPYRANLWALKELGVERVLGPTAVGSLQSGVKPGDFVVSDQLVDRTSGRPSTFYDGPVTTHVSFADPYCPVLREVSLEAAARAGRDGASARDGRGDRGAALLDARRVSFLRAAGVGDHQHDAVPRGAPGPRVGDVLREHLARHGLRRRRGGRDRGRQPRRGDPGVPGEHGRLRDLLFAAIERLPEERTCECGTALANARFEA